MESSSGALGRIKGGNKSKESRNRASSQLSAPSCLPLTPRPLKTDRRCCECGHHHMPGLNASIREPPKHREVEEWALAPPS